MYRSVRLASALAAALLDGLSEQPGRMIHVAEVLMNNAG